MAGVTLLDDFDDDISRLNEHPVSGDMFRNGHLVVAALHTTIPGSSLGITLDPVEFLDRVASTLVITIEIFLAHFILRHPVRDDASSIASRRAGDQPCVIAEEAAVAVTV